MRKRLVLGELVAGHDLNGLVVVIVACLFDEFEDGSGHCTQYSSVQEVKAAGRG